MAADGGPRENTSLLTNEAVKLTVRDSLVWRHHGNRANLFGSEAQGKCEGALYKCTPNKILANTSLV